MLCNIVIIKAKVSDANLILDINVDSWKNTYKNIFPKEFLDKLCNSEEDYLKALNKIIKKINENDNYLVAVYNDEVVGFSNFGKSKKEDYSRVVVSCLRDNPSNEFYKKMSCKKIGECNFLLEGNEYIENLYEC